MMTSKGQVTVPKSIRDELGLKPGRPVRFEKNDAGEFVLRRAENEDAAYQRRYAELTAIIAEIAKEPLDLDGMTVDEYMDWLRERPEV